MTKKSGVPTFLKRIEKIRRICYIHIRYYSIYAKNYIQKSVYSHEQETIRSFFAEDDRVTSGGDYTDLRILSIFVFSAQIRMNGGSGGLSGTHGGDDRSGTGDGVTPGKDPGS